MYMSIMSRKITVCFALMLGFMLTVSLFVPQQSFAADDADIYQEYSVNDGYEYESDTDTEEIPDLETCNQAEEDDKGSQEEAPKPDDSDCILDSETSDQTEEDNEGSQEVGSKPDDSDYTPDDDDQYGEMNKDEDDEEELYEFIAYPIMGMGIVAFSANHGHNFITRGELQDANGVPQTVFAYYDHMRAYFEYVIPDGTQINAGDTMTVVIPPQLRLLRTTSFNLYDINGAVVGIGVADVYTNIITITFTDYYEIVTLGRQGNFWISVAWERSEVQVGERFSIRIPHGSTTTVETEVTVTPGQPINPTERLFKWGWIDDNLEIIHWVARVNFSGDAIYNAVFTDNLGPGHVLVNNCPEWPNNNIWIEVGYFEGNAFRHLDNFHPGDYGRLTVAPDGSSFVIELGNLVRNASTARPGAASGSPVHQNGVSLMIHYTTRITDSGDAASTTGYSNQAVLTGDNIASQIIVAYTPVIDGGGTGGGYYLGSLLLSKRTEGEGADLAKNFTFTVTFSNPVIHNGSQFTSGTVTLAHGGTALFTGIPFGTTYTIVEADYSAYGYVSNQPNNTVTGAVSGREQVRVTFTNTYTEQTNGYFGNLLLNKRTEGEGADLTKSFTFTVTFSNPVIHNGSRFTSGTITLAHGETALFTGIPFGTTYTIVEADYSEYGYVSNHPDNTVTGVVNGREQVLVTFTNTYSEETPGNGGGTGGGGGSGGGTGGGGGGSGFPGRPPITSTPRTPSTPYVPVTDRPFTAQTPATPYVPSVETAWTYTPEVIVEAAVAHDDAEAAEGIAARVNPQTSDSSRVIGLTASGLGLVLSAAFLIFTRRKHLV